MPLLLSTDRYPPYCLPPCDWQYSAGALAFTAAATGNFFSTNLLLAALLLSILGLLLIYVGVRLGWTLGQRPVIAWPVYSIMWARSALR